MQEVNVAGGSHYVASIQATSMAPQPSRLTNESGIQTTSAVSDLSLSKLIAGIRRDFVRRLCLAQVTCAIVPWELQVCGISY